MRYGYTDKRARSVTPLGSEGYSLHFSLDDPKTLGEIREFQSNVTAFFPGWMTRLEAGPGRSGVVHVFPAADLPSVIFRGSSPYGKSW